MANLLQKNSLLFGVHPQNLYREVKSTMLQLDILDAPLLLRQMPPLAFANIPEDQRISTRARPQAPTAP